MPFFFLCTGTSLDNFLVLEQTFREDSNNGDRNLSVLENPDGSFGLIWFLNLYIILLSCQQGQS